MMKITPGNVMHFLYGWYFKSGSPKMERNPTEQCLGTLLRFIAVDVVGPLPEMESARQYLLVAMDFFRK